MMNENLYSIIAVCLVALVTVMLRTLPFVAFGRRKLPKAIQYLSEVLPFSIMTILVCYCLRHTAFLTAPFGLIEISAVVLVAVLQCTKKNMYVSIVAGTVYYMLMIRL